LEDFFRRLQTNYFFICVQVCDFVTLYKQVVNVLTTH